MKEFKNEEIRKCHSCEDIYIIDDGIDTHVCKLTEEQKRAKKDRALLVELSMPFFSKEQLEGLGYDLTINLMFDSENIEKKIELAKIELALGVRRHLWENK